MTIAAIVPRQQYPPNDTCSCEVDGLSDELIAEEGLSPTEAFSTAAGLLDELSAYVAGWDSMAFLAGDHAKNRSILRSTIFPDSIVLTVKPLLKIDQY